MANTIYDYGDRFRVEDLEMETNAEDAFMASLESITGENVIGHIIKDDDLEQVNKIA